MAERSDRHARCDRLPRATAIPVRRRPPACPWRAGCGGTRTSGSEGGGEQTTAGNRGIGGSPPTLLRADRRASAASAGPMTARRIATGTGPRRWDTRAGEIELQIPKLRQGSYFPAATVTLILARRITQTWRSASCRRQRGPPGPEKRAPRSMATSPRAARRAGAQPVAVCVLRPPAVGSGCGRMLPST